MLWSNFPILLLASGAIGLLSSYLATKRGKNPIFWFMIGFFFGLLGVFAIFFSPNPKRQPALAEAAPTPYIQGPSDKFWYYLDNAHQQTGPISYNALNSAWQQGTIAPTNLVWHEELPEWKPLKELIQTTKTP